MKPLLPLTKFGVVVSGVVPFVFAMAMLLSPSLTNSVLWPPPFEPLSVPILRYTAAAYLSFTIGMVYVLAQNDWRIARSYLVVAGSYNALSILISLLTAVTPPGIPPIVWLYILLAFIYLAVLVLAWRQQSTQTT